MNSPSLVGSVVGDGNSRKQPSGSEMEQQSAVEALALPGSEMEGRLKSAVLELAEA